MNPTASPNSLRRLPLVQDLPSTAPFFGIGRTLAYELAQAGEFPCPVRRYGRLYRVRTADILDTLGLDRPTWAAWHTARLQHLPPVVDLPSAAKLFTIGRTLAYDLVRTDEFPCPVRRYGRLYRVRTIDLLDALGLRAVTETPPPSQSRRQPAPPTEIRPPDRLPPGRTPR